MIRVLCVGNPYLDCDSAGPRIFEQLVRQTLPSGVELIDAGLQGLNLLRFFEDAERVILIDNVRGYLDAPGFVHLQGEEIQSALCDHFDHSAGLAYLLQALPALIETPPALDLLGIEGVLTDPQLAGICTFLRQLLADRAAA